MRRTYIKVRGRWVYLYRAVDAKGGCVDNEIDVRGSQGSDKNRGTRGLSIVLDTSGQTVSPVGQCHGEPAVRIRVNNGAETGPAGDENQ